ncbi:hypothetical protein NDU88_005297 [Pleurodeles waltl]|uniref:Uncharacterized protein n=1 Tax=Pleurodeles waltl TaxID=8319 RepID=A0AAV7QHX7_PLEWA|nr:hypothetical protein NDU88_005297 [Pleurodeles waltl]
MKFPATGNRGEAPPREDRRGPRRRGMDYAGTVLYLELSSSRPASSSGRVNSAGEEGKFRRVTPRAGSRRLKLDLCGATRSGSSSRHRRVPTGPSGTPSNRGPVPRTPGHQRLSGRATLILARSLASVTEAGECALLVLHSHRTGESPLSPLGPRPAPDPVAPDEVSHWLGSPGGPSRAARLLTLLPFPPTEAGVPFSCAWPRVCFQTLRPSSGPRAQISKCQAVPPEAACVFGPYGVSERRPLHSPRRNPRPVARSLPTPRVPHRVGRSTSASPGTGRRNSSLLLLRAGAQRRFSSAGAFPPVDVLTPLRRPRPERGSEPFVGLTRGSGSERPRLGSRASASPRWLGPGRHFVLVRTGRGPGTGAVLSHLFTSTWSPRGRGPTGALEAAPLA